MERVKKKYWRLRIELNQLNLVNLGVFSAISYRLTRVSQGQGGECETVECGELPPVRRRGRNSRAGGL